MPLIASSEFGSEKWRMRPSVIVALPENSGCASGPSTAAVSSARPEPRTSRKKPCRMPRFASPVACSAIRCVAQADGARQTRSRVSSPTSCSSSTLHAVLIEREADRRGVLQRVVEQPHVERVDGAVDEQMIDVRRARRRRGSSRWRRPS